MTLFKAPEMSERRVVTAPASAATLSCLSESSPASGALIWMWCTCFVASVTASTMEEMADWTLAAATAFSASVAVEVRAAVVASGHRLAR
jgi:hypothetical protein